MNKGILVSPNSTTTLTTAWQVVLCTSVPLTAGATTPAAGERFCYNTNPGTPHFWKIECDLSVVGSAANLYFMTTYDAAGTKICDGPSQANLIGNLTGIPSGGATNGGVTCLVNTPALWPTGTTAGNLYVWVKADVVAPTAPVIAAKGIRAVFTDLAGG